MSAPQANRGTTSEQRENYLAAVASAAARFVRQDDERRAFAIETAFSYVDPFEFFPPTMANVIANLGATEAEIAQVERRVNTLLTLGQPIDRYPTARTMSNGATVADWLGTAKTAADVASLLIERVRNGVSTNPVDSLDRAEAQLTQALDELRAVRTEVER